MLKKLFLTLTILTTSLFSFQVDIWKEDNKAILNFNIFYDNVSGDQGTNWVAIYKKGDSNDWDNVITWAWADDLAHNEEGNYDERIFPLVTKKGSYEVRFFLDNSYEVFKSIVYNNDENNNASLSVSDKNSNTITFNSSVAKQAWIGIYDTEDSNDWHNVKAWEWARDTSTTLNISNLDRGTYEARLFYNNSYDVETTVNFTKESDANNKANIEIKSQTRVKIAFDSTDAEQAWIGIYNKGDTNDWKNIKIWKWVDSPTTFNISRFSNGTYEARLFYNNSYFDETSIEFTKDSLINNNKKLTREELKELIANNEDYSKVNISGITNMNNLFYYKTVTYDITKWDVSHVTNMAGMFRETSFNQNIENWDVSNVTNMDAMFLKADKFNQPIGNWDVSSVTDMSDMFRFARQFNQPIENWDVSSVTDMSYMFWGTKFNQPIGSWNVGNVTDMSSMFPLSKFNQPIGNWDVSHVTDMHGMFGLSSRFNQPIGNWDVSHVTDMHSMFNISNFNQPIGNWDVSSVTDMGAMFRQSYFNQPIGNWDVSKVKDMSYMFKDEHYFNQSIGNWDVSHVTDMRHMFHNASKFNQSIKNWDVSNVENYTNFSVFCPLQEDYIPAKFR